MATDRDKRSTRQTRSSNADAARGASAARDADTSRAAARGGDLAPGRTGAPPSSRGDVGAGAPVSPTADRSYGRFYSRARDRYSAGTPDDALSRYGEATSFRDRDWDREAQRDYGLRAHGRPAVDESVRDWVPGGPGVDETSGTGFGAGTSAHRVEGRPTYRGRMEEREGRELADRAPRQASPRPEGRRSRWQKEPLRAGEIMTRNPVSVHPDDSIRDIARIMRDENTGVVPVVDAQGRLQGLVTDRDIVMRSLAEGDDPLAMRAEDVMSDDIDAVAPDESVHDVIQLMGDKQVRRVPVVDSTDRLVGIISMADVATRADYDTDLQDALEDISSRRSFWSRLFG